MTIAEPQSNHRRSGAKPATARLAALERGEADGRPEVRDEWLGIDIRHLLAFEAIARLRSFSRAADELGYVQSAISHQLAYLERIVDARLVRRERGPKPVDLTEAGELLLSHTRGLLAGIDAARDDIDALAAGRLGALRLAVCADTRPMVVGALVARLHARLPQHRLSLTECDRDETIVQQLTSGAADAALTELPLADGSLRAVALTAERHVLAVAAGSTLARLASQDAVAALRHVPVVIAGSERSIERILPRLHRRDPRAVTTVRADRAATARSLAARGRHAAIVPALARADDDPRLEIHELASILPVCSTGLAWSQAREHDPLIAVIGEEARRVAQDGPSDDRNKPVDPESP